MSSGSGWRSMPCMMARVKDKRKQANGILGTAKTTNPVNSFASWTGFVVKTTYLAMRRV
ncbi:hypothetical protein ACIQYF_05240 [Pseudomonas sp. NPDC096917]|uniref:hypothetical protein n=1 Tax=Pseudomonas sp. NPDC096917 TaxID=3364483 RepID=UPI00383A9F95